MKKELLKAKVKEGAVATATFLRKHKSTIMSVVLFMVLITPQIVFAGEAGDAEWSFLTGLIKKWGSRIGGALALFGGIEFGLAWKDNDPAGKSQGLKFVISGLIVLAVCANADVFLK